MSLDRMAIAQATAQRVVAEGVESIEDAVAVEAPLEIRVETRPVSVTMRTPGADEELALGFLWTERVLSSRDDVLDIRAEGDRVDVFLRPETPFDFARLSRHVFASSSCGVCGKASVELAMQTGDGLDPEDGLRVAPEAIHGLPDRLRAAQSVFDATGGLHAAALCDAAGQVVVAREDVGRHNAVDKVIGWRVLSDANGDSTPILMVSGRVSFEIVQKALAARIPLIAAVSAPTSLAVELAKESGVTLIGFLRSGRFNLYAHPHRALER